MNNMDKNKLISRILFKLRNKLFSIEKYKSNTEVSYNENKNCILIKYKDQSITFLINSILEKLNNLDENEIIDIYLKQIDSTFSNKTNLSMNNIFPLLVSINDNINSIDSVYKENYNNEFNIVFVENTNENAIKFIGKKTINDTILKKSKDNLNTLIQGNFVELCSDGIFCYNSPSEFVATKTISKEFQEEIKAFLGEDFIFAIPDNCILLITRKNLLNHNILDCILEEYKKENEMILSDKIFTVFNEKITDISLDHYSGNKINFNPIIVK